MKLKSLLTVLSALILIPAVSAFSGPLEFLDNEWVRFAILFAILFAVMYSFFKPKFKYNAAPTTIVSAGLSILLTIPIMKRGILETFVSPNIVDWVATIATLVVLFFIIRWFWKKFKLKGIFISILALGIISIYAEEYIPENLKYGPVGTLIAWIQGISWLGWILFVILIIFWIYSFLKKKGSINNSSAVNNSSAPQVQQQAQQQARAQRDIAELQSKYRYHSQQVQQACKNAGGPIPKKGTPEYKQWSRATQAMKEIEKIANRRRLSLK